MMVRPIRTGVGGFLLALTPVLGLITRRSDFAWHNPSPHKIQFVTVDEGVQLEVLDWGGSGRNVVLLAGSGNMAHVYDGFAEKLTSFCHVLSPSSINTNKSAESGSAGNYKWQDECHVAQRSHC